MTNKKSAPAQVPTPSFNQQQTQSYSLKREEGGYAIYQGSTKITEPNVLAITISKLNQIFRKELGL